MDTSKALTMDTSNALEYADTLVFSKTGKHLSDLQRLLFKELWLGQKLRYEELAQAHGYSSSYLKQDAGPKLWQLLSDACGEKVSKANFRSAIMRQYALTSEALPLTFPPHHEGDRPSPPCEPVLQNAAVHRGFQDWGDAPDVSLFYDRQDELKTLEQWIVSDRCRLAVITGMGGIGKTYLSVKLAEQIQNEFDYVIWRSLRNAPPLQQILTTLMQAITNNQESDVVTTVNEKISRLIEVLRQHRCLLILDNVETILQSGTFTGHYRENYEDYGELFKGLGECRHRSCLLLTTREKPKGISVMQGDTLPVRCLSLRGLKVSAGLQLLKLKGCFWRTDQEGLALINQYGGNPLALKIVAATIQEVFEGNISEFIQHNSLMVEEIRSLLDQHFSRLSDLGKTIFYWLAINLEPVTADELYADIYPPVSKSQLLETLKSLVQRSLIEKQDSQFSLQPVVMEYALNALVKQNCAEMETGVLEVFNSHALLKAQSKEYLRKAQIELMVNPIIKHLLTFCKTPENLEKHLQKLLVQLRSHSPRVPGYAPGNLLNLLCHQQANLSGYDFSNLTVWQAYLQNADLHRVNFTGADLSKSIFAKHLTNILSLAFSPDGKYLATGDVNGEIRLWFVADSTLLKIYQGHAGWVHSVAFSPDGKLLCSGSSDQTVKVWDVNTGNCLKTLLSHNQRVRSVAFSPDNQKIVSGSSDRTVRLWDVQKGYCQMTFSGHNSYVWSVSFSPDGRLVASGSEDHSIKLWDTHTGEYLQTLQGHSSWVRTLAFSPDGQILASGSGDRTIKLWDLSTGKLLRTLYGHSQRLRSLAFSPDGQILASGGGDHTVKLWDWQTGHCLKTLHGHSSRLSCVAFNPEGSILASSGEDRTVRLWDVHTGNCISIWQGYASWFQSVTFSPDGHTLASGSEDGTVKLWQMSRPLSTPHQPLILKGHTGWVCSVAFSSDGKTLASASSDYTIKIWDTQTGTCRKTLVGHTRWIRSVAFSPNGKILASGSGDTSVKLWEVASGKCLTTFREHAGWLWAVTFSPDGQQVASASEDRTVKLWCVRTGQCLRTFEGHTSWVQTVAFSPDGRCLVSGSCDHTVKLWDVETGECLKTFWEHSSWVQTVAFSPDGNLLASGSCDQAVKFWEIDTGKCWQTLPAHDSWVWSIAFSPDGSVLASAGQDETIKLWNISTGECLETLRSPRPYEGMCLAAVTGLTEAQLTTLKVLGAVGESV